MDHFIAEIRKIPLITRILCASSLGVTVPVLMHAIPGYKMLFSFHLVTSRFEIWRIYTCFFLGRPGLGYVFEVVMLYRMADQLETRSFARRPADFVWQLILAGGAIMLACQPLGSSVFSNPLLVALAYLSSALAPPGSQTSFMGLITLPVTYLPYIMIVVDLLSYGPHAAAEGIAGAVVGHFWWWTMWVSNERGRPPVLERLGRAPQWLQSLIGEGSGPRGGGGVQVFAPPGRPAAGSSSRHNWGSGRRLGN